MNKTRALGQNFLVNQNSINEFLQFSDLKSTDVILEIGIGVGALTGPLTKTVKQVVAIEIDTGLTDKAQTWSIENLKILNINFLDCDLKQIIKENNINKIVASIPYSITSPIIHKIIRESCTPLVEIYLIAQKEFVNKIVGRGDRSSYFTFLVSKWANIKNGSLIGRDSFNPVPKVDSQSFSFSFFDYPKSREEVVKWSKFVHFTFASPRKKINKRFELEVLNNLNIDPNIRPENLTLKQIISLYNLERRSK